MSVAVGRRVAQWRVRRRMTQQVFADRIGRSKSWVEKVERGVRRLDRFSLIQQVAEVLRVDPAELLGADRLPTPEIGSAADGVAAVRAALACYDVFGPPPDDAPPTAPGEAVLRVEHAWSTYRHGDYPQLLRTLPALLDAARRLHVTRPGVGAEPLVQVYRIVSAVLVKVGEPDLAWLAADRALATAGGDQLLAASAAVQLGQALRALDQGRLAMATTITAAHGTTPPAGEDGPADRLSVSGALLLQAALAAAVCGDRGSVAELLRQAAGIAARVGDGHDHRQTGFGPTAVDLAAVVTAAAVGDAGPAVRRHEAVTRRQAWRGLPAEHRAAYLVDAARVYLDLGDPGAAGRSVVEADRVAPAEIRCRPSARTLVAEVARCGPDTPGVARLATALGLTTGASRRGTPYDP
ncbi:helix-turn-helix domain-containing protein [Micromonospora sp. NBC_01813]|uniref:helix-turn-helix domain-containing protein n=1 Tax=Micromonospora sp. NBC_01813 TaxID=2975988 RepID=UPI002DDA4436|nr:helix-turn-helix domain-containing protein [Micromonospora sp. NBC_01813]WSA11293.1 helix-turn-helix domain-containing protein [Micromonospora sp. NBC_01813]